MSDDAVDAVKRLLAPARALQPDEPDLAPPEDAELRALAEREPQYADCPHDWLPATEVWPFYIFTRICARCHGEVRVYPR